MEAAKGTLEKQGTSTENVDDSNHNPQSEQMVYHRGQKRKTHEEDEEELFKTRAKLFRFTYEDGLPKWEERGTGYVKLLKHTRKGTIRLLMRRDKTLKICANHYITPLMELKRNAWSKRAWVWNAHADFADESPKRELLALRYPNAESARKFKENFEQCRKKIEEREKRTAPGKERSTEKLSKDTEELLMKEDTKEAEDRLEEEEFEPEEALVEEEIEEPEITEVPKEPEELLIEEEIEEPEIREIPKEPEEPLIEEELEEPEISEISKEPEEPLMEEEIEEVAEDLKSL
ncbi:ran-specific GTPase-activating protein-like [Dromiciops gliroides]|uniref:ran-specific GTPase-activating protein-like n=1 Tax=Dromiciops gliroides TaxID=33562 RepID=UPI001CC5DCA4|nr:ran-specific GTPase-activating protein-like [Dromiciops gliroides]